MCALITAWGSEQVLELLSLITGAGGAMKPRIVGDKVSVVPWQCCRSKETHPKHGHAGTIGKCSCLGGQAKAPGCGMSSRSWRPVTHRHPSHSCWPGSGGVGQLPILAVHILGGEVLSSVSPQDALGPLGGAACAGAVLGKAAQAQSFLPTG